MTLLRASTTRHSAPGSKDVNGVYYINANLPEAQASFAGVDDRPRYTRNRIYSNISNAIVLKNQDRGNQWNIAGSLEKAFANGLFAKAAYSYGASRNTVDAGSIASGSWTSNQHSWDPNAPSMGYSSTSLGHRWFAVAPG